MNDYKNFCEYVIRPEQGSKIKFTKALLLIFYTLFCAAYIFLFWVLLGLWTLLILLPFLFFAIYKLTWRFVNVEYDVALEAGELTVAAVYGGASRRVKCRAYVLDMTLAAPYSYGARALEASDICEVRGFTSSGHGEDTWVFVYPDKKRGKKHALVLDTTPELIRAMRICNPGLFSGIRV